MSVFNKDAWIKELLSKFPELDPGNYDNLMSVWMDLRLLAPKAVQEEDEVFLSRIFDEMEKFFRTNERSSDPGNDPYTAVVIGFIEDMLNIPKIDHYIVKYVKRELFNEMSEILKRSKRQIRTYDNINSNYS